MWAIIATWNMAYDGVLSASKRLASGDFAGDALVQAIKMVEDYPFYKSVGFGGLPNQEMMVELDAAYMDGDTLSFGAVGAIQDFANPILIARSLSKDPMNNFLVGSGAQAYAHKEGFERKNMLTERAKIHYQNRLKEESQTKILHPYIGHDTVGMVALDQDGHMVVGTSTSGLFMKRPGRLGDSPVAGAGFYVDSEAGGATITGLGEDVMKGALSYEIVRLIKQGYHPQDACDEALESLDSSLRRRRGSVGDISIVALDKQGRWGSSTNIGEFSFVVASASEEATVYLSTRSHAKAQHKLAPQEWIDNYNQSRHAELTPRS